MASVQELLAAANAQQSPLVSLVQGLASGATQAYQDAPARRRLLLQDQLMQEQSDREKAQSDQLAAMLKTQADNAAAAKLPSVGAPGTPATPAMRLAKVMTDDKGYLKPVFETAPPKSLKTQEYQDDQGVNRLGTFDPAAPAGQGLTRSPNDPLAPKPAATLEMGVRDEQFNQKQFDKLLTANDPGNASSRTAVGMLGRANLSAKRALETLNSPTMTNQDAGNVMADIASIYQNGSPSAFGMSEQAYHTVYGNVSKALQSLTGQPTDAVPDAIKQHLRDVLTNMASTNQAVIKGQLDGIEASHKKLLQWAGSDWTDWRKNKEDAMGLGGTAAPAPASADGAHPLVGTQVAGTKFKIVAVGN